MGIYTPNLRLYKPDIAETGWRTEVLLNKNLDIIDSLIVVPDAKGDGVTDDTDALLAALAIGKSLYLKAGTYLFSDTLILSIFQCIFGEGQYQTYLKKASGFNGIGVKMEGAATLLADLQVDGEAGNGGDGIALEGNTCTLRNVSANHQGGNGIRIGKDSGSVNCNFWTLDSCSSGTNGGHGVYIHDYTASPDGPNVNAGTATRLQCSNNGGDGLRVNRAYFDTFTGYVGEGNGGWGVNNLAGTKLMMFGGDVESNTLGGVICGADSLYSDIYLGNISNGIEDLGRGNVIRSPLYNDASYVPIIYGLTTTGDPAYTVQTGTYKRFGKRMDFEIAVEWSDHDGTGQMAISLPFNMDGTFDYIATKVVSQYMTLPEGSQLEGLVFAASSNRVQLYTSLSGLLSALDVQPSGRIWISGTCRVDY